LKLPFTISELLQSAMADGPASGLTRSQLGHLLDWTNGRAIGLWQRQADQLCQLAFTAHSDMPSSVQTAFCAATEQVPISAINLGIVAALVAAKPVLARAQDLTGPLDGSANWLVRFESASSISIPITLPASTGNEPAQFVLALASGPTPFLLDSGIGHDFIDWVHAG
jgi:hypothetical protein